MCTPAKNIDNDTPTIISGNTIGIKDIVCIYERSLKRYQFTPIAPIVPITVAVAADDTAIMKLLEKARHNSRVESMRLYQRNENPVQFIPADSLNE